MDYEALRTVVYKLNEDEQFYKKYYYAKQQEYSLQEFLSTINIDDVLRRHLLVPEIKETIPPRFEDNFFFDAGNHVSITVTLRHLLTTTLSLNSYMSMTEAVPRKSVTVSSHCAPETFVLFHPASNIPSVSSMTTALS